MEGQITFNDFRSMRCVASIFTPDDELSPVKVIQTFLPKIENIFDQEPTLIPNIEGMPKEIPRIILKSSDNSFACEISPKRFNVIWSESSKDAPAEKMDTIFSKATEILEKYQDYKKARVGRIAAIATSVYLVDDPGKYLAKHFCDAQWLDAPFNRPETFELHAHKRYSFIQGDLNFTVNSWVRNKTGYYQEESGSQSPILLIEQDLNTPQEEIEKKDYSTAEIKAFFGAAPEQLLGILKLYYPV